jgi:hypothetical protein
VLLGGVLGVGRVEQAQREADDVSAVTVALILEVTRRAGDGSAYGFARLEVADPAGRAVALHDLDLDVPGVRLGSRGTPVGDLEPAPELVLPLRLAVPDCAELRLPGSVSAWVSRPGRPGAVVRTGIGDDVAGTSLRRACGLPPPP